MTVDEPARVPNACPWTIGVLLGAVFSVVEIGLVILLYRNLPMPDQWQFIAFYGFSVFAAVSLATGVLGSLSAALFAKPRRAIGIGVGVGIAGLVMLLARLVLVLGLAAQGVPEHRVDELAGLFSPLGIAGLATSGLGALVLGAFGYLIGRSSFRRIRYPRLPGLLAAVVIVVLFAARSGDYVDFYPMKSGAQAKVGSPSDFRDTNVLLISIDTLRADHLGGYGYGRDTAPRLDALAEQGVLFERAITQRTNTAPAMAALLTGTYPPTNKVLNNRQYLQDFNLTIAEVLTAKGFSTSAVVSNPNLTEEFNFDQGFDEHHWVVRQFEVGDPEPIKSRAVNELAFPILEKVADRRFFMWIHYTDPHGPYLVPPEFRDLFLDDDLADMHSHRVIPIGKDNFGSMRKNDVVYGSQDLDFIVAQYDAEIRFNDGSVASLLDKLDELGLRENTLVVLTADHGESMWEHEYFFQHGDTTYEPTAHVPLVFAHPMLRNPIRVETPVSLVDLTPTILDLLGLPVPSQVQGESFAPMVLGEHQESYRPYHFIMGSHRYGYQTHAVSTSQYKLILDVDERWVPIDAAVEFAARIWMPEEHLNVYRIRKIKTELYDLVTDPGESKNLAGLFPDVEESMSDILWAWIEETYHAGRERESMTPEISRETEEALRALGYL